MEKLNKVIEVMEECHKSETNCKGCPYYGYMTGECIDILMKDALELLKKYRESLLVTHQPIILPKEKLEYLQNIQNKEG